MLKKMRKILDVVWQGLSDQDFRKSMNLTFSQCGEDCIIRFILSGLKIKNPTYLDIGAYDPFFLSNTARFYLSGCRGINIEPNPEKYARFKKFRKEDINLNIGISNKKGKLKYFMLDVPTLNTFSEKEATRFVTECGRKIIKVIDIPVDTIDNIISTYARNIWPDFLSLDAEGTEMDVIARLDSSSTKPKIICVETIEYRVGGMARTNTEILDILCKKGYFIYGCTHINSILVLEDLWRNR